MVRKSSGEVGTSALALQIYNKFMGLSNVATVFLGAPTPTPTHVSTTLWKKCKPYDCGGYECGWNAYRGTPWRSAIKWFTRSRGMFMWVTCALPKWSGLVLCPWLGLCRLT